MIYKSREPWFAHVPLVILCLVSRDHFLVTYLIPFCLLMMMLRYELHIHEDELQFQFKLLTFPILTRRVAPENIRQIEFRRVGWSTKRVVVRIRNGVRWNIVRFYPGDFSEAIRDFADRHSVHIRIDRDFQYL